MAVSKLFATLVVVLGVVLYFQMRGLSEKELTDRIHGKRVLVTGASLGIGRELVKQYADLGAAEIVLVARSEDKLVSLRDEVYESLDHNKRNKPKIHVVPADLSAEDVCRGVIDKAIDAMGSIDYLVLNHITNSQYGLWTEKENHDFITNLISVNTLSYIWMATHALPALEKSHGQIMVVSSFAGHVGVPHTALYSASKFALRGFFNALRVELQLYKNSNIGITICTIGATDTEGTKGMQGRISGITWEDPRVVGDAIVESGAARQRELFYPYHLTYPSIVFNFVAPQLMEKFLRLTMN